jgi:ABC-type branched-subunit amino acid transport system ATPase component
MSSTAQVAARAATDVPALELRAAQVSFGGLTAVNDVSLRFPRAGGISAIIGPNGAGKTTVFNVLTGIIRPSAGQIVVDGRDMTGRRPDEIFRAGVARTFQGVRLFAHLSVRDNVQLAARSAPRRPGGSAVWIDPHGEAKRRTEWALAEVGLARAQWSAMPDRLTLLERRLAEIARALTVAPIALLLDEPAAGLNTAEKERLCALLTALTVSTGCRIVVIEHDMKLVMAIAQHISVMNFGCLLAEGTPAEIRRNEAVIEAYLGTKSHHD